MKKPLTKREKEILVDIMDGLTDKEISEKEIITISTVKSHVNNLYKYFGVHTRSKLLATVFKAMWKERENALIRHIDTKNKII